MKRFNGLNRLFRGFILIVCLVGASGVWSEDIDEDDSEARAEYETENSGEMRDPTRPLSYVSPAKVKAKSHWRLDSVLISSQRKLAVINGEFVREQGWIKGAQVTQIENGRVTIMVKGKPKVLTLSTDIRKVKVEG
ncbi:MAG: hypothetical protein ACRBBW_04205 [Cellvibrionaceae bacterium]